MNDDTFSRISYPQPISLSTNSIQMNLDQYATQLGGGGQKCLKITS